MLVNKLGVDVSLLMLCRLRFSVPFYTISLYDALKIRSTGSFSFLAILQYSKYCRFAIVHQV